MKTIEINTIEDGSIPCKDLTTIKSSWEAKKRLSSLLSEEKFNDVFKCQMKKL